MLNQPYQLQLEKTQRVLIAGAGGGFDIFCGLPLYFALKKAGKQVHLANLSFTQLNNFAGDWVTETMMRVTASIQVVTKQYFPEYYLCQWFQTIKQESIPIYAFSRTGATPLRHNYEWLIQELNLDTIILVDGGTDSLMRGDEDGLGTPEEDFVSLTAVSALAIHQKLLVCLGFGVDYYHGVSNDLTFEAIAHLTKQNAFLGSQSLLGQMPEVEQYYHACKYVFEKMETSIVSSSILAAIAGEYGNYHSTQRTKGSPLWINPLMPIYWFFLLDKVAEYNLMVGQLHMTEFYDQVRRIITIMQRTAVPQRRNRQNLPN